MRLSRLLATTVIHSPATSTIEGVGFSAFVILSRTSRRLQRSHGFNILEACFRKELNKKRVGRGLAQTALAAAFLVGVAAASLAVQPAEVPKNCSLSGSAYQYSFRKRACLTLFSQYGFLWVALEGNRQYILQTLVEIGM